MPSHFKAVSGCYACRSCGKKTRATGYEEETCELCAFCYNESVLENYHNDNDGCDDYDPACPLCNPDRPSQLKALCDQYNITPPKEQK